MNDGYKELAAAIVERVVLDYPGQPHEKFIKKWYN